MRKYNENRPSTVHVNTVDIAEKCSCSETVNDGHCDNAACDWDVITGWQ